MSPRPSSLALAATTALLLAAVPFQHTHAQVMKRGATTPTLACKSPMVASADGSGCVCPPGLVKQGDGCAPAGRAAPSAAPRQGIQERNVGPSPGMQKRTVGPDRMQKVAPSRGMEQVAPAGPDVPGARPTMGVQKQRAYKLRPGGMQALSGAMGTMLEVRTFSGDVHTAWEVSHRINTPQTLTFRWKTNANAQSTRMKVTGLGTGSPVTLQETTVSPPTGEYGFFTFPFPAGFTSFVVGIVVTDVAAEEHGSFPVNIEYGPPEGPTPQISMPVVRVKITKIDMIDDSDDLSTGEVDFCFWATHGGKTTPMVTWHHGDFGSGASATPNVQIEIDPVPGSITLHAKGRDDDLPPGGFSSTGCGGSTSDFDFASGSQYINLPNAPAGTTPAHSFSSFVANGNEDLEFRVHGTWQVVVP